MTTRLVVPGLLGPMPRADQAGPPPGLPHLERLLARADRLAGPTGTAATLFACCGLSLDSGADLPTAALSWLGETGSPPGGYLLHADPVHLRPDQDRLLLFDAPSADLTATESAAYLAAFNALFAGEGLRLEAPSPGGWYLRVAEPPRLRTHPLEEAVGRNVDLFLPSGPDAPQWQRRLTEVQMLFHGLSVSAEREAAGRLPVNGIWLSGGGRLPDLGAGAGRPAAIRGGGPLLRGLARHLGIPWSGAPSGAEPLEGLVYLDAARRAVLDADPQAWFQALAEVEALLARHLGGGGELRLYPADGRVLHYHRRAARRFWRRPRGPLALQDRHT